MFYCINNLDWLHKINRSHNQWQQEEKVYFNTILAKKSDAMNKAVVDQLAPKLDQQVMENRLKLQQKQIELNEKLQELKSILQSEYNVKIQHELEKMEQLNQIEVISFDIIVHISGRYYYHILI
jgi:hypothetical protein